MRLIRVVAPHFVAGFETDGAVKRAAPIIRYMIGWTDDKAREYVKRKGWTASVITAPNNAERHTYGLSQQLVPEEPNATRQ